MGPEDNPVDDMPADKLEYELWERERAAKDRQYPKCRHCSGENHYGQKYDGYCFDCHNHGVIDLIDERDAAVLRADRAEAERDANGLAMEKGQTWNVRVKVKAARGVSEYTLDRWE